MTPAPIRLVNPATGEIVKEVPSDSLDDVHKKAAKARVAQGQWASRPYAQRQVIIGTFKTLLEQDRERLALLLASEMGKPIKQARSELAALSPRIDFFLEHGAAVLENRMVYDEPAITERIGFEPLGVVANISAWNYPYFVGSNVFVPALLMGNSVLYKPSELVPLTGLAIAEHMHKAGVPEDVFVPVIGKGDVGAELLNANIDGVFFTGSFATGAQIAAAAAPKMIKMQLELGGKDPAYVCDDVDVEGVAESLADGAFYNTGQSCCSIERIYVHAAVYERFVECFLQAVQGFVVGDPHDDATYIGPLAREPQLAVLAAQVHDAKAKGAKVLLGGERLARPGFYFAPTVLVDVNHTMAVMREESFGPIIGIQKVSDDAEALKLMNDTEYGLTAGVFTRDGERAMPMLDQLNAGSVYWNCSDRVSPRLPWTGRKHSGIGATLSTLGIETFVRPKAYHLRRG